MAKHVRKTTLRERFGTRLLKSAGVYPQDAFALARFGYNMRSGYIDIREVGNGSRNSAVVACLRVYKRRIVEPPLVAAPFGMSDTAEFDQTHQAVRLWNRPNKHMTAGTITGFVVWSKKVDGNAYLLKARNLTSKVVQLWPLIPSTVEPMATRSFQGMGINGEVIQFEDDPFIGAYKIVPGSGPEVYIPPADMIHFRDGIDQDNPRVGDAPLKSVLREILGDEAAGQFATALVKNSGVFGTIISPKPNAEMEYPGPEEAEQIKATVEAATGGPNRGRTVAVTAPIELNRVAFSPNELNLETAHRLPEQRIAGVLGVPPILAGLGAGITASSGRNESETLIEDFTTGELVPEWRAISEQLTLDLLPEFETTNSKELRYDLSQVRALQEDKTENAKTASTLMQSGVATRAEARQMNGLIATPDDDVYYVPIGASVETADGTVRNPQLPAAD